MQGETHRSPRRKVLVRARMRADGPPVDVCIRDISSTGMLLQADAPPPRGTYVEISRGLVPIVAKVIWAKDRRFGVSTRDPIDIAQLVDGGSPAAAATAARRREVARPATRNAMVVYDARRGQGSMIQFAFAVLAFGCVAVGIAGVMHAHLAKTIAEVSAALAR